MQFLNRLCQRFPLFCELSLFPQEWLQTCRCSLVWGFEFPLVPSLPNLILVPQPHLQPFGSILLCLAALGTPACLDNLHALTCRLHLLLGGLRAHADKEPGGAIALGKDIARPLPRVAAAQTPNFLNLLLGQVVRLGMERQDGRRKVACIADRKVVATVLERGWVYCGSLWRQRSWTGRA
jgi:hypothetical protein